MEAQLYNQGTAPKEHGPIAPTALRQEEESQLQARSGRKRIFELDALRGIAAVTVVAYHTRLATTLAAPRWFLRWAVSGTSAVVLFFVLSGYVLSLPYCAGSQYPYWLYLRRRFVRIYVPFVGAAVLSIGGALLCYRSAPHTNGWFEETWHTRPTWGLAVRQVVLPLDTRVRGTFNTAFWSVVYEAMMSVILPGLLWVMKRVGPLVVCGVCLLAAYGKPTVLLPVTQTHVVREAVQVLGLFALGATIAAYDRPIRRAMQQHRRAAAVLLVGCAAVYGGVVDHVRPMQQHIEVADRGWLITGLASAGVIAGVSTLEACARVLRHGVLEYLGKISYSLYLVHSVALFAVFSMCYGRVPLPVVWLLVGLVAWGLAQMFFLCVEAPCIAWVRRLR